MSDQNPRTRTAVWLATGLGVGLVSPAPGTVGGLWGLLLAWSIVSLPSVGTQLVAIVAVGLVGVLICSLAARALGGKDPQAIVFDEIAALPIAYIGVDELNWSIWLAGWLLFRFFDISKPPPVKHFERLPHGWGIMADDWVAAVYACLALHAILWSDRFLQLYWLTSGA